MARPDQSMSLLADLQRDALEPEYRQAAALGRQPSTSRLALTLLVLAALITMAGLATSRASSDVANERAQLLQRVGEAESQVSDLEARTRELEAEIRQLGDGRITDEPTREALALLGPIVGDVPVTGPGLVLTIDDSATGSGSEGIVYDTDLVRLVNGLWQSGAEAVAINGRRLSALTAIRSAGSAITVDFVSLSPPYTVEAIGDPSAMQGRFARTIAAVWWQYLKDNYGVRFDIKESAADLELSADPGMALRFARITQA